MMMLLALAAATPDSRPVVIDTISRYIEYRKEGDQALLVHAFRGGWYRVTFKGGSCPRLTEANGLTFVAGPLDTFSRFDRIVADGFDCAVADIVHAEAPTRRRLR